MLHYWILQFIYIYLKEGASTDIYLYLLNIYRDQMMDVSPVMWWLKHFSSGDNDEWKKPNSRQPGTHYTKWRPHLHRYQKYIANGVDNVEKNVLELTSCSMKQCYCVPSFCCSFHGKLLLSEQFSCEQLL